MSARYDVIVVGGGHAGTEAALAAARSGARSLLLTHALDSLGQLSCNPAIGGIGKGHLAKEIDALGGLMARAADRCGIQFRILNAAKGAAVRATRAQIDRALYRRHVRAVLDRQPGLHLFQQEVCDLDVQGTRVCGVRTRMGQDYAAAAVVLTTGTFLAGRIHLGETSYGGGRAGEAASLPLAERLRDLPLAAGRLKTGTPPRIDGRTVDYSRLQMQAGDEPVPVFSFLGDAADHPPQVPCHIARTTSRTHAIVRATLERSPLYNGRIRSVGPRYCPSIEDKIVRFADRDSHQVFIEPEGLECSEVYPNGISTSLPFDVQCDLVRSIPGLERAHLTRPGYAIEYDFFDPRGLHPWLETRALQGLFLAGQINGTTGYEEAAAQGLVAGLNAARKAQGAKPWYPRRDQAYIGVLIDDLTTQGAPEPYRMFTSRAEYRLLLREDNADLRLTPAGRELGLISERRWRHYADKRETLEREREFARTARIAPDALEARPDADWRRRRASLGEGRIDPGCTLAELLRRPGMRYVALLELAGCAPRVVSPEIAALLETEAQYAGYIERQRREVERNRRQETLALPAELDYSRVSGLSAEAVQRLNERRPATLGQAARIPGVTPAAISLLRVYLHVLRAGRAA